MRILLGEEDIKADSAGFPFFRAGHAHAGVLSILGLVGLLYVDRVTLGEKLKMVLRVLMIAAPLLVSGGMFGVGGKMIAGAPPQVFGALIGAGALVLAVWLLILGVGLIRTRDAAP